jgi:DNA-directed RNA polymerase subunit alpha
MEKKEYRPLTIPKLAWNTKNLRDTYGELVAQPLEPGFGITLGNALRRILLGGVEGCAVTSVIIKGINNEFSVLQGVEEDAMQIVLNIKKIVIRNKTGKPGKMKARLQGEGILRVADIVADDHLELINKDHIIAHVAPDGELDIEFFVENGRGYQSALWPEGKPLQEDNRIYLDSMFSPVTKVSFDVEKTRVGSDIDYDKLILYIYTDGSENPLDALHYSISVLRTQLHHFQTSAEIPFNEISKYAEEYEKVDDEHIEELRFKGIQVDLLMKPIEELELSVRAHNCLVQSGIKRILDLVNMSEEEGLKIKNFGRKSLNEVRESLKGHGLSLGMDIKEEDLKKLIKNRDIE